MKNEHIEEFERWWVKTTFGATRGWSRDGERKFLPCSPRKLARAAWNAAWHVMQRELRAQVKAVEAAAEERVRKVNARLGQAKAEIDALEYKVPMTASEFESRLLEAKDACASAEVRAQHLRESLRNAVHAAQASDRKVAVMKAALRTALDAYEADVQTEHIIPSCVDVFENRIRAIVEVP